MASLFEQVRENLRKLPITVDSCAGGTYIVTGANTGLGYEVAKHYVRLGAQRVILAVRSVARGEAAKANIEKETGVVGVAEVWHLDLGSYASVKQFAGRAARELDRIDVVMENASVALQHWTQAEGMETSITVNVIGTFLLAALILPKLKQSAEKFGITPHLTVVSSNLGFTGNWLKGLEGSIFDSLNSKAKSDLSTRYHLTKLLQMYGARELADRLPFHENHVVINYLNPGLCTTELVREASLTLKIQIAIMRFFIARTAEMGSRVELYASTAGENSHGKFISECVVKEHWLPDWLTNEDGQMMQKRVWSELAKKLEEIEPGCLEKALGRYSTD